MISLSAAENNIIARARSMNVQGTTSDQDAIDIRSNDDHDEEDEDEMDPRDDLEVLLAVVRQRGNLQDEGTGTGWVADTMMRLE